MFAGQRPGSRPGGHARDSGHARDNAVRATSSLMRCPLARVFEDGIARHPADWHMLQKVFVADLDTGRLRPAGQQPPPAG